MVRERLVKPYLLTGRETVANEKALSRRRPDILVGHSQAVPAGGQLRISDVWVDADKMFITVIIFIDRADVLGAL